MPADDFASRELSKLISQNDEMRRTLRRFEQPLDPIAEAFKLRPDPLGLNLGNSLMSAVDAKGEARRLSDLVSGIGSPHSLAANLAGIGVGHRSVLEQIAGTGALSPTVSESLAAAAMGLPNIGQNMSAIAMGLPTVSGNLAAAAIGASKSGIDGLAARIAFGLSDHFRFPEMNEMSRLLRDVVNPIERQYGLAGSALEESLRALQQPWLNIHDSLASVTGFAKLHGIGHLVATEPPFAAHVARALRVDFGDWRDPITWPSGLASDASVRAGLYIERGFNPLLTEFPLATFEEGWSPRGCRTASPS